MSTCPSCSGMARRTILDPALPRLAPARAGSPGLRPTLSAAAPLVAVLLLAGCETPRVDLPPPTVSIAQLYQRPAERALIQAIRLYEDGAFDRAETGFRTALQSGLKDTRDTAVAHKYLAFIACAFNRIGECEQGFRAALGADPDFRLGDAEVGHPIWGPVYKKVLTAQAGLPRKDKPEGPAGGQPGAPSERSR